MDVGTIISDSVAKAGESMAKSGIMAGRTCALRRDAWQVIMARYGGRDGRGHRDMAPANGAVTVRACAITRRRCSVRRGAVAHPRPRVWARRRRYRGAGA